MRQSLAAAGAVAIALLGAAVPAAAQTGVATEGALFLLVPIGARTIAQGQSGVAARSGSGGITGNPATLGWASNRIVSVDHARLAFVTGDAIEAVVPAGRAGVLGASLLYFNYGDQAATDQFGTTIGTIYSRAVVLAGTYAAPFGDRVSAGVTYKYVGQEQSCSGACENFTTFQISTAAVDFGVQAVVDRARRLTVGGALRNAGFGLQTIDREQADPLPARLHFGADYAFPEIAKALAGATLHGSTELVTRIDGRPRSYRIGAELGLADRFFVRAGALTGSGDGSTAAVGFGIRQGTLALDFARTFGGRSSDAGEPPTYVTLRVGFR